MQDWDKPDVVLDATFLRNMAQLEHVPHRSARLRAIGNGLVWKTMATAPKDREILLVVNRRAGSPGKMLVGHWCDHVEDHPPIMPGWYFWNGCMFDLESAPLLWAELPKVDQDTFIAAGGK